MIAPVAAVDLSRLEALVTLADELHFGRAAERLGVEVSTLSRRIRALEVQLGVELFARSSRRVTLTPAGAAVSRQAARVLAEADALEATASEAAKGRVGELRAAYSSASAEPMAQLLRALRDRQPHLTVTAHRSPSPKIASDVAFGHLSFGICQRGAWIDAPALGTLAFGSMPIDHVMVPASHRLAGHDVVDVHELEREVLVWPPTANLPALPQLLPVATAVHRASSSEESGLVDDVAAGYGIYVCTADAARRNPRPDVVVVALAGSSARAEHAFVWRVDDDNPALRAVRDVVDAMRRTGS
jgi:DNA-binding transcriptional LysR family regulator